MKNYVARKTLCLGMMTVLLMCMSVFDANAETTPTEPVKLKVVALPYLSFAPFFIAQEEGFFTEQGLAVEFVKMDNLTQTLPVLLQGQLDVTAGSVNAGVLNAMARGGDVKIVADKGYLASAACVDMALVVRSELAATGVLTNPEQVRKLKLTLNNPNGFVGYYTEKVLTTLGLTLQEMEIPDIPNANLTQSLETGAVDIANAGEPWLSLALKNPMLQIWQSAKDVAPDFQYGVVLYGPNLLIHHPDVGQRFMVAYVRGIQQYQEGKTTRNLEILAKHTGLTLDILSAMCWPAMHNDGSINATSILDFQAWIQEKGLLDHIVSPDQFWDGRFVEYARQTLRIVSQ